MIPRFTALLSDLPLFSTDYDAFGRQFDVSGSERYRFVGLPWEASTGLTQMGVRFYDDDTGRFLSADPVLGQLSWPQTLNRYAYVANNPLRYTDPTGKAINLAAALGGAIAGAIIGGALCAASQGWSWSDECWIAVGAGAVAGGLAGLTFGASLWGNPVVAGIIGKGVLATAVKGVVAGFISGFAGSVVEQLPDILQGSFDMGKAFVDAGWGALGGAVGALAGYGLGKVAGALSQRLAGTALGRAMGVIDDMLHLAGSREGGKFLHRLGASIGTALFKQGVGKAVTWALRRADPESMAEGLQDIVDRYIRANGPLYPGASTGLRGLGNGATWYVPEV